MVLHSPQAGFEGEDALSHILKAKPVKKRPARKKARLDAKLPRHSKNVPGPCYVEDGCCTNCGVPMTVAPELFSLDQDHCFVSKQPHTPAELAKMLEVLNSQEVGCVRYEGSDPTLIAADLHGQTWSADFLKQKQE